MAVHCRGSEAEAEALAEGIRADGGSAAVLVADLSREEEAGALVGRAAEALGGPCRTLVNNASRFEHDRLLSHTRASWDAHMETHLRAPVALARAFAEALPGDAGGAIVNVLDQRVRNLTPHYLSYSVSRAGLWAATRVLALELAPRIRVNAIGPGPTLASEAEGRGGVPARAQAAPARRRARPVRRGGRAPLPARRPRGHRADHPFPTAGSTWGGAIPARRRRAMGEGRWTLVVRDMEIDCLIGVHAHEKRRRQLVRISVDLDTDSSGHGDDIARVVSYEDLVSSIKGIAGGEHMHLVETLADRIAEHCLGLPTAERVRVTVLKPEVLPGPGASRGHARAVPPGVSDAAKSLFIHNFTMPPHPFPLRCRHGILNGPRCFLKCIYPFDSNGCMKRA